MYGTFSRFSGGVEVKAAETGTNVKNTATLQENSVQSRESLDAEGNYWRWCKITVSDSSGETGKRYTGTMEISSYGGISSGTMIALEPGWSWVDAGIDASYVTDTSGTKKLIWSFKELTLEQINTIIEHCWLHSETYQNPGGIRGAGEERVKFITSDGAKAFLATYFGNGDTPNTTVTDANYSTIVSSKTAYDALSASEKADVDRAFHLTSSGTVTYESLYNAAKAKDLPTAKSEALANINTKKDAAIAAIRGLNLTEAQKNGYIQQIEAKCTTATTNVNNATTVAGVETILSTLDSDLAQIKNTATAAAALKTAKENAVADIDAAARTAKDTITTNPNLTDEEMANYIQQINDAVATAKDSVNAATDVAGVNTEKDTFNSKIADITNDANAAATLKVAKETAVAEIADKKTDAIDAINGMNLTDAQKRGYIQQINDEVAIANAGVNAATDVAGVNTAKDTFNNTLEQMMTIATEVAAFNTAKENAVADITAEADTAKNAINNNPNLTAEQKADYIQQINATLEETKAALNEAATDQMLLVITGGFDLTPITDAATAMGQANLGSAQNTANADVTVLTNAAKAEIDAMSGLSDAEKTALKNQIDQAAETATTEIAGATTVAGVDSAKNKLNNALNLAKTKAEKIAEMNIFSENEMNKIKENDKLSEDEKEELIEAVKESTADATAAIMRVTNTAEIAPILTEGKAKVIADVKYVPAMEFANTYLRAAFGGKIYSEINADNVDQIISGKDAWEELDADNQAKLNEMMRVDTEDRYDNYEDYFEAAKELKENQDEANAVVTASTDTAKAAIDAMSGLSDAEKTALKNQIDQAAATATTGIHNAVTVGEVDSAKDALENALDLIAYKTAQMKEMNVFAAGEIEKIKKNEKLSEKEKEDLVNAVQESTAYATNAILDATNTADITPILTAGKARVAADVKYVPAMEFANGYLRAAFGGKIYSEINADNIDQILSGKDAWSKLDADNQAKLNAMMKADTNDKYNNYEEYFAATEKIADENANAFIQKYLTRENGSVVVKASREDVDRILASEKSWNALSETEKSNVNAMLANAGATQTFESILADAKQILEDVANKFIKDNQLDKDVNEKNYQEILNSKKEWDQLTQREKNKVNSILADKYGKTYEEMIASAEETREQSNAYEEILASAAQNGGQVKSPKTGDANAMMQWCVLMLMAGACMFGTVQYKKRNR